MFRKKKKENDKNSRKEGESKDGRNSFVKGRRKMRAERREKVRMGKIVS